MLFAHISIYCIKCFSAVKEKFAAITESATNKNNDYKTLNTQYQDVKMKWRMCQQQLSKKKEQIYKEDMKVRDLEKEVRSAK